MSIEIVDALQAYGEALLRNGIASSAVLGGEAATGKVPEAEKEKLANESESGWNGRPLRVLPET